MRKFSFTLIFALLLVGFALPGSATAAKSEVNKDLYQGLDLFAKALHFVRQNYVESPDDEKLVYGAIKGMMEALDPHTVFMPPDNYQELQSDTQGRFGGVGIEVTVRDKVLTVITPIEGTPAQRAGLRPDDRILKVDGKSTRNMSLGDAVKLMRGKRGTKVRLVIARNGRDPFAVTLRRDIIRIQSVRGVEDLGDGIAYIRISAFQQDTANSLEKVLSELEQSSEGLRGLVIDLRNNPGGLLSEAVAVADKFLSDGIIVKTKSRSAPTQERRAKSDGTHVDFPIVILVNKGSASAAEIVAGALQDHKRAILIGTQTFGKGSVQTVYELGEGAAVKLTVARYYTPKGRSIQSTGIKPNIIIKPKRKDVKISKKEPKETDESEEIEEVDFEVEVEEDPQREAAVSYLRKKIGIKAKG